jgi:acetyl/propionyl-CoA carboxylase alpha subunit
VTVVSPSRRISRLLVADRGEVACRVFRTARARGLGTVAVYSAADAGARHVREADLSVRLDGGNGAAPYLDIVQVVEAARRSGADAVHPGYGFLAENADFAQAVIDAGLLWFGPDPDSIRVMGSKLRAKEVAAGAGLPLLPAAEIVGDDGVVWAEVAERVGFPLLVKASAGGGGKGMHVVESADTLVSAIEAARREAHSAFGDPTVFVERFVTDARHVEVQVVGDRHGTVVDLGERECSIQRRHQKVVEECPSPGLAEPTREVMRGAAVALARSVGYVGLGTVEFVVVGESTDQEFFFLEMNTRLQVEHPVTEAVTGLDLVGLQLRVAEGWPLDVGPEDVQPRGHAIEVRVYAEDPAEGHRPSTGRLARWDEAAGVRWDSGVTAGDAVTAYFDPLLAKVVSHADDRATAAAVLARALRSSCLHGVTSNVASLAAVLESPEFLAGSTTTDFLDRHPDVVAAPAPAETLVAHLLAAALHGQVSRRTAGPVLAAAPSGWRNVRAQPQRVDLAVADRRVAVAYELAGPGGGVNPPPVEVRASVDAVAHSVVLYGATADSVDLEVDGVRSTYVVSTVLGRSDDGVSETVTLWVSGLGRTSRIDEVPRFPVTRAASATLGPVTPVPGTVTAVLVAAGDAVTAGDPLVMIEAMKMEHRVSADQDGTVTAVHVAVGDSVDAHQVVVSVAP